MKKCIVSLYVINLLRDVLICRCASADTNDKTNKEKKAPAGEDAFANANDMFKSADLCGTVNGCSDTGCTIAPLPFSSIEDDGTSSSEGVGSNDIIYTDETIFQKARVDSDGNTYSISDGGKNELKDGDIILCFGHLQADDAYLAEKIIMIEFNYD